MFGSYEDHMRVVCLQATCLATVKGSNDHRTRSNEAAAISSSHQNAVDLWKPFLRGVLSVARLFCGDLTDRSIDDFKLLLSC